MSRLRSVHIAMGCYGALVCATGVRADARAEIAASYRKNDAAVAAKDVKGTMACDTADYTIVDRQGNVRKVEWEGKTILYKSGPEFEEYTRRTYAQMESIHQQTAVQKITRKGGQAIVSVKQHTEVGARNPQTQKLVTFAFDITMEDTWLQQGGIWKRKRSRVLAQPRPKIKK